MTSMLGKYKLGKTLGEGGFSKVKMGKHKETNEKVAIKIMKKSSENHKALMKLVVNEIKIMGKLNHPNIVNLLDYSDQEPIIKPNGTEKECIHLVLEVCTGGELFDYIAETGEFSEPVARYFFK